jgi:O-antigen/teichoic acid export membrane protein
VFQRVKELFRSLLIYGVGDVATSVVSLLLLPFFTKYLTPADFGMVQMLLTVEAVAKVVFRWGVDTAFMRLYYDCTTTGARQRLASTLFFFLLAVNGTLVVAALFGSPWLSLYVTKSTTNALLVSLTILNTFGAGFFFIPYQVLRIGDQPKQYIALTFGRSAATIVARLVFVIGLGMGVFGIVISDVVVTAGMLIVLTRWFAPLIRPVFSRPVISEALAFGLPRIPHSLAQQVIGVADSYVLNAFGTLADVGLYSIGARFGLALKLFLSAFESAWTPFFLAVMREDDAPRTFAIVSTYVIAVLVLLVSGTCVVAPELLRVLTKPAFHAAVAVVPPIVVGVMFQGFFLVGSIGLVIRKRTTIYPLTTGIAAAASVASNLLLVPRYGMMGAAWSNAIAYATLSVVTTVFSSREYPIPYEWDRLARIAAAGAIAYGAAVWLISSAWAGPWTRLFLRGAVTIPIYAGVLFVTGFFHKGELQLLQSLRDRTRRPSPIPTPVAAPDLEMPSEPATDPVEMADEAEIVQAGVSPDSRRPNR